MLVFSDWRAPLVLAETILQLCGWEENTHYVRCFGLKRCFAEGLDLQRTEQVDGLGPEKREHGGGM